MNLFIQNEDGNTTLNGEMLLLHPLKVKITKRGGDMVPKEKRRSTEEPATMTELPNDVLINVLIRLPAKLLAQLRCVSKHWNAFISQHYFIKSYVHFHRLNVHNNDEILLVFLKGGFTTHHSNSPHIELANFIKLPVNFPSAASSEYNFIGSINGLICFSCELLYRHFFPFGFDPNTDD